MASQSQTLSRSQRKYAVLSLIDILPQNDSEGLRARLASGKDISFVISLSLSDAYLPQRKACVAIHVNPTKEPSGLNLRVHSDSRFRNVTLTIELGPT